MLEVVGFDFLNEGENLFLFGVVFFDGIKSGRFVGERGLWLIGGYIF